MPHFDFSHLFLIGDYHADTTPHSMGGGHTNPTNSFTTMGTGPSTGPSTGTDPNNPNGPIPVTSPVSGDSSGFTKPVIVFPKPGFGKYGL